LSKLKVVVDGYNTEFFEGEVAAVNNDRGELLIHKSNAYGSVLAIFKNWIYYKIVE